MTNSNDNRPRTRPYAVGYGKPPETRRFQKGQSGNPNGRPRKTKTPIEPVAATKFDHGVLAETQRLIKLRENGRHIELPVGRAIIRSLYVAAVKGDIKAQRICVDLESQAQARYEASQLGLLMAAIDYKDDWTVEFAECDRRGEPRPDPVPHPDDIIVDPQTGAVIINGPLTEDERAVWHEHQQRRVACHNALESLNSEINQTTEPYEVERLRREIARLAYMHDLLMLLAPDEEIRRKPGFNLREWQKNHPALQRALENQQNRKKRAKSR